MKWSKDIGQLADELDGILTNLSLLAYSVNDGAGKDLTITRDSIADSLFSHINHAERIVEDLRDLEEIDLPQTLTETVTTTKTLYL